VTAKNKDHTVEIIIEDMGEGIPEDKLENIFKPFYRVNELSKEEKGSKGLGLGISKAILDKHGGTISIKSKFKKGTTVVIELLKHV